MSAAPAARRPALLAALWPLPRAATRALLLLLLRPLIGLRIEGLDNLPRSGPVLVAGNHLHNADPILVAVASPRPLHYMAKRELFGVPIIGWLLRMAGSFPVNRGRPDRTALRTAEERLARGIALGMFPEGTRSTTRALGPALAGAGMLALRSGAPVVPVAITGTERLPLNGAKGSAPGAGGSPRRGVLLRFGEPFVVPRRRDGTTMTPKEATDLIMLAIARLLPPEYRGIYPLPDGRAEGDGEERRR